MDIITGNTGGVGATWKWSYHIGHPIRKFRHLQLQNLYTIADFRDTWEKKWGGAAGAGGGGSYYYRRGFDFRFVKSRDSSK